MVCSSNVKWVCRNHILGEITIDGDDDDDGDGGGDDDFCETSLFQVMN